MSGEFSGRETADKFSNILFHTQYTFIFIQYMLLYKTNVCIVLCYVSLSLKISYRGKGNRGRNHDIDKDIFYSVTIYNTQVLTACRNRHIGTYCAKT